MIDFRELAKELFLVLKSYSDDLILYDESGTRLYEPEKATRMFSQDLKILLSLIDDGENSCIRLYVSDSEQVNKFTNLIQTLRTCAVNSNVLFSIRKMEGSVTPDKFATPDKITEDTKMNICEGMYGTSHSSYLKLESAKVIVRHTKPVREGMVGARGRSIKTIFVENAAGERVIFPVNSLMGARAYAQHINQGGGFADAVSAQIVRITGDYQNLRRGMAAIEPMPSAMSNGVHLSVGIHEAITNVRKTLLSIANAGMYCEAVQQIGQLVESDSNSIEYIKSITGGKLSEDIMKSISNHVSTVAVTEQKDPTIEGFKDRDIDPSESGWAEGEDDDGDGAVSEGIKESLNIFESWLDDVLGDHKPKAVVAEDSFEEIIPDTPPAPVEDAPTDAIDGDTLAMISAINMAQEALSQAMQAHVDKFATMPAHQVVEKFIIPEIHSSINDRKTAYDGLVNAVDLALNGGDQTALMAMLDVAATADGYHNFVDFAFSASIGEFIAPEQYVDSGEQIEELPPQEEPQEVQTTDDSGYQVTIDPIIDDAAITQLAEESGVVGETVLGEKEYYTDFKSWYVDSRKIEDDSKSRFSVKGVMADGTEVILAKWNLSTEKGWIRTLNTVDVPVEERRDRETFKAVIREQEDDALLEDLITVIQSVDKAGLIDKLQSMSQFDDNRDFYSAVSSASRGDSKDLTVLLDQAAQKIGSASYADFEKSKAQSIKDDYLADIGAEEVNRTSNVIDLNRLRHLSRM